MSADLSKEGQLKYRGRKRPKKYGVAKEAPLQRQLDDMLAAYQIPNIRVSDGFWAWLHGYSNATPGMKSEIGHYLSGWPDNVCLLPIGDGYCLALMLELKAKEGKMHKSQKRRAKKTPYKISRTPDENIKFVEEFRELAEYLRARLESRDKSNSDASSVSPPTTDDTCHPSQDAARSSQ